MTKGDAAFHYAAYRPGRDGGEGRDLLIPVQAGGMSGPQGLWVGGAQISSSKQLRGMMLFLGGANTTGSYQPSHLWLREQIFIAMSCHPHRRFEFRTTKDLEINILIRANAVVALGTTATTCGFPAYNQAPNLAGGDWESYSDPRASLLERVPPGQLKNSNPFGNLLSGGVEHVAFRSIDGVQATQAIDAVITRNSVLDCQLGVEASMLAAIRRALDAQFDQLHPQSASHPNALTGLGIPLTAVSVTVTSGNSITARANANRDTAFGFHMVPVMFLPLNPCNPHGPPIRQVTGNLAFNQRPIVAEDMVPGDYAYLSNPPDYETWHPGGDSNGENALFAGRKKGKPLFEVHGITGPILEEDLKVAARNAYNLTPAVTQAQPVCDGAPAPTFQKIETGGVTWTLLAGPTRAGDPKEAGPYVR